eukprot:938426-Amphidinium_carterae.1
MDAHQGIQAGDALGDCVQLRPLRQLRNCCLQSTATRHYMTQIAARCASTQPTSCDIGERHVRIGWRISRRLNAVGSKLDEKREGVQSKRQKLDKVLAKDLCKAEGQLESWRQGFRE